MTTDIWGSNKPNRHRTAFRVAVILTIIFVAFAYVNVSGKIRAELETTSCITT